MAKRNPDDYSEINDREIPNPMETRQPGFGVMANSDGRRVNCEDPEERKNVRRF